MPATYKTSEVAEIIGIHPNTVRLYEKLALIPQPVRRPNGYRVFTDFHVEQLRLVRTALKIEVLQNGLRKMTLAIIRTSATGNLEEAEKMAASYIRQIKREQKNAEEAIEIVKQLLSQQRSDGMRQIDGLCLTRKQTADLLDISIDTLRNWELNGLLTVRRKQNGYRVYFNEDINRLKIIRSLRCANYSLSAILRMLNELSRNPEANIEVLIDTPSETDTVISVCDKLLTSLRHAEENASRICSRLDKLKNRQRLFIVLALLPDPDVVFLDELTTGFDTRARRDVWKFLSGLKAGGLTIFLTSHFMDEVEALCDRIMILRKGGVIFHGTVEEAIASSPFENFEDTYLW